MLVLAHAGHWYVSMIYAAPALLLGGGLAYSTLRERRRQASKPAEHPERD